MESELPFAQVRDTLVSYAAEELKPVAKPAFIKAEGGQFVYRSSFTAFYQSGIVLFNCH